MPHHESDTNTSLLFTRVKDVGIGVVHGGVFGGVLGVLFKTFEHFRGGEALPWTYVAKITALCALSLGIVEGIFGGAHTRQEKHRRRQYEALGRLHTELGSGSGVGCP